MTVSIIVSIYNIVDYLSYCLNSLIYQDYQDLETILVDDGSKDGSSQLCDEVAKSDSRIKEVHKPNGGLSSARNAGLDIATGKYVLFIDGDDYLTTGAVSTLVAIAEVQKVDFIQFGYEEVFGYTDGKEVSQVDSDRIQDFLEAMYVVKDRREMYKQLYALGGVAASACTKFMHLETVKKLRFKEGILHEDEEFTTRLLAQTNSICYINMFLPYKYVMREGSIIHAAFKAKKLYDISAMYDERLEILKKAEYMDLVSMTASRYFGVLMLLYGEAMKFADKEVCAFIHKKAKYLLSSFDLQLSVINRIIAWLYNWGIPGADIYYGLRKLLGK